MVQPSHTAIRDIESSSSPVSESLSPTSATKDPGMICAVSPSSTPASSNDDHDAQSAEISDDDAREPYGIRNFVEEHEKFNALKLWDKLGIGEKINGGNLITADQGFFTSCDHCSVAIYDQTDAGDFADTVLLRIDNGPGLQECRYLLFKWGNDDKYRLVGFIDHDFGKYEMPKHRWIESHGKTFLVVRCQTVSGSGVAMYFDRLFTMNRGRLQEILDYPADGHEWGVSDNGREFTGKVAEVRGDGAQLRIKLLLKVKFGIGDSRGVTYRRKTQHAEYVWSPGMKLARFDPKASDLTKNELENVYDATGALSDADLKRYSR
jgi:hypothetical protein